MTGWKAVDLGVRVDAKLPTSQQATRTAKVATSILGCIKKTISSRLRG